MKVCVCVCFCRLKPFTSYKLRMLATNDIGDSALSKETEAVTTLQDGEKREGREGKFWDMKTLERRTVRD